MSQLVWFWTAVATYMAVACGIGLWHYRRASNEDGFHVAGRSLGPVVGGATLMANQVSAGATIGIVGFHYYSGISYAWTWPLVWIGWVVCALWVAPKIRRHAGFTLPEFFEARYDSRAARAMCAVFVLIAYTVTLSAQYQAGGLLLALVSGLPFASATVLVAAMTTVYTFLGGMYSNAYVGVLKAVLLLCAYLFAVPFLWSHVGGLPGLGVALTSIDPRLTGNWFGWRQLISISLALGLGLAAAPYEISAIYSMQSRRSTRLAIGWSFLFQACIGFGVLIFGLSARVLVPQLPEPDLGTAFLGTSILPFWSGLLVLLAAVVTFTRTGGAILLTVASAVSHDLYGALVAPGASAQAKVRVGRCAVVLFSAIPVVLALRQLALVNFVVIYAGKLLVSFLFVPVVIGLNWRRATAPGAIAAMLGGLSVCVGWSLLSPNYPLGIDPWEIATATSLVLFVLVSRATTPVRRDKLDVFFPAGDGEPRAGRS